MAGNYDELPPHRKGELTEAIVTAELKRRNVPVSKPTGDNERYDLIVQTPSGKLLSVQVKTGDFRNGAIAFKGTSQHTNSEGNVYKRYDGDVDYFIVYSYETEDLYWVREDEIRGEMRLRVDEPNQPDSTINWASQFEFDERWPPTENGRGKYGRDDVFTEIVDRLQDRGLIVLSTIGNRRDESIYLLDDGTCYRSKFEVSHLCEGRIDVVTSATDPDCYLVFCPDTESLYVVGDDSFDHRISLRIQQPDQLDDSINPASEFEFGRNWPPGSRTDSPDPLHPAVSATIETLSEYDCDVSYANSDDRRTLSVTYCDTTVRLRVENAWNERGRLHFNVRGVDIDYYVLYYEEHETLYLVSDDDFDKSISLRVDPPERSDPRINWAEDYRFTDCWPPSESFE